MNLAGKFVVVTGASAGIGEAVARRCAAAGASVAVVARRADRLAALEREIGARAYVADLSKADDVEAFCERLLITQGVPDIVVNNAGAGRFLAMEETSNAEAVEQMALPYFAAFFVTRGFIEPMLARGSGVIMQVNSPVALVPWPGAVGYAASRFALRGFTEALRQDLWGTGIRVGSVTPPRVQSDYFDANPGAVDRVPRVEALVGTMTSDQAGDAVVRAIIRRPSKDTYVPWRWGLAAPFVRRFPGAAAALFRTTGHSR